MATVVEALGVALRDEVEAADEIFSDPELIRLLGRRTCREYGPAQVFFRFSGCASSGGVLRLVEIGLPAS